jgi:hypothetical protein
MLANCDISMLVNCDSGVTACASGVSGFRGRLRLRNRGAIVPNRLHHVLRSSVGRDPEI